MSEEKKKILIIEDEDHISEGLKLNLTLHGHEAKVARDGVAGLGLWKEWQPDLIILDLMLPGLDGSSLLKKIRQDDERLPVLVLSAKDQAQDKVELLRQGVDDYLAKPFHLDELLLRVDRLLTKLQWFDDRQEMEEFSFGPNYVNFSTNEARNAQGEITLTAQEMKLLKLFVENRGRAMSRNELLEGAWGYAEGVSSRTVDNFVVRLRRYFEIDPKRPEYFQSVRSIGYVLRA